VLLSVGMSQALKTYTKGAPFYNVSNCLKSTWTVDAITTSASRRPD
jgi:hypothetical protein